MKTDRPTLPKENSIDIFRLPIANDEIPNCSDHEVATSFELIWITNVQSNHWVDFQTREISPNQILCVVPGQIHKCNQTEHLEGYIIRFKRSFLEDTIQPMDMPSTISLLHLCSTSYEITLQNEIIPQLTKIVESMIRELQHPAFLDMEMVKRYFEIFLIHLTRLVKIKFNTASKNRNTDLVEAFTALIERNFKEKKMVLDYASQLAITPNYLNEIVKKTTGHSAGQLIRQRIALEAKRQAMYSGLCMKEVAYKLGFTDIAHFSKFFKNNTGKNFSEFKKTRLTFLQAGQA